MSSIMLDPWIPGQCAHTSCLVTILCKPECMLWVHTASWDRCPGFYYSTISCHIKCEYLTIMYYFAMCSHYCYKLWYVKFPEKAFILRTSLIDTLPMSCRHVCVPKLHLCYVKLKSFLCCSRAHYACDAFIPSLMCTNQRGCVASCSLAD